MDSWASLQLVALLLFGGFGWREGLCFWGTFIVVPFYTYLESCSLYTFTRLRLDYHGRRTGDEGSMRVDIKIKTTNSVLKCLTPGKAGWHRCVL